MIFFPYNVFLAHTYLYRNHDLFTLVILLQSLSDEIVVDMAPDGTVYGIELLNANEQLKREDMGELVVVNEATGEHTHLPLVGK